MARLSGASATLLVLLASTLTNLAQPQMPLSITCWSDITVSTCGDGPVAVEFATPNVFGDCSSNAVVTCSPPSGSLFPLGTNVVQCVATDTCGNSDACSFNVIVAKDTAIPWLVPPTNIVIYTANAAGTHVFYGPYQIDDADPDIVGIFAPASGSFFPIGTNTVHLSAVDSCGNSNGVNFTVEVRKAKVGLGGNAAAGGLDLNWDNDEGLECADSVTGPWEPVQNPAKPLNFQPNRAAKFFRPAPGIDHGIPTNPRAEIAYVSVGLQAPEFTPGAELYRFVNDDNLVTSSLIHTPSAGGSANTWSDVVSIPFKFWFYGEPRTQICVSKNGLLTFTTDVAGTPVGNASDPRTLPNQFLPEDTVACFQSPHVNAETGYSVRAYLEGSAPNRQVWIIWHNLFKPGHGKTHTALVLEESSNRLLMADMFAETPSGAGSLYNSETIDPHDPGTTIVNPLPGTLACGVQRDTNRFTQIPASPNVKLVNDSLVSWDNDFYIFKPFQIGRHVKGESAAALSFIDQLAIDRTLSVNIPGTTVAVTYKGRLVYNKSFGFANVEKNITMLPHHRTPIGSVSKVLTAAGVFKLIELGVLDLTNRITEPQLLGKPWFMSAFNLGINNNVHPPAALTHLNAITLEHLMNHTSGYRRSSDGVAAADLFNNGVYATSTYTNGVQWFMATQSFLTNAPGLLASYSNHGPGQLGMIIEIVTGLTYEAFMQQFLLQPHGIKNMRIGKPQFLQQNQQLDARRYDWYDTGAPHFENPYHGQLAPNTYDAVNEHPGAQGSWTGTARDLARFMVATDKLKNHSDLLPPALLTVMESNSFPNVTTYAKGWRLSATTGLEHGGLVGYGAAFVQKNTSGVNIAVTCNTGNQSFCSSLSTQIRLGLTPEVLADIHPLYDLFGGELQFQDN